MIAKVVVVANPDKAEALRLAADAEAELRRHGAEVAVSRLPEDNLAELQADLAVVFGGDGTVLGAVSSLGDEPPPILAFNVGRLGYLAGNHPGKAKEIIAEAMAGALETSCRMMVEARILESGGDWLQSALNEFVLVSPHHGRLLPVSVWVDCEELMEIRGDGIIIATPTGSTAYALSAGGPVASPELRAIILAPICPHQLANRSLVLDPVETVRVCHHGDQPVELLADGRLCRQVEKGQTLEVRVSRTCVRLLSRARGRYHVLREKLGWGWKAVE